MPEAATAAPPAATPPPATAPGAAPNAPEGTAHAEAYAKIEELFPSTEPTPPETKPPAPETKAPESETKPPEGETKPPAKPGETAPAKPPKAASLREALDTERSTVATLRKENEELKKQLTTPRDDPEFKKLKEEREGWHKTKSELEDELRFAKYERTAEYKDKYEKPFIDAYASGRKSTESLTITDPTTGQSRKGAASDFDDLMGISDDGQAWEFAKAKFGDRAQIVWTKRERVQELNHARLNAIEEFRSKGTEREKQMAELAEKQHNEFQSIYDQQVKTAVEDPKLKDWFVADEGDAAAKEVLERGFKMADEAFGDTSKMTTAQRASLYAAVRNRTAAAGLLAHKLKAVRTRLAEVEAKLQEYEESEPNLDGRGGRKTKEGEPVTGLAAVDQALDKMAVPR